MAHFAQIDENNVILNVIVVDNKDILDEDGNESEEVGIQFCKSVFGQDTNWVQSSYNCNFRYNHASVGGYYDPIRDAFVPPRRYRSWHLDEEVMNWAPPIPRPESDFSGYWAWDEKEYVEDTGSPKTKGWVYVPT